MRIIYGLILTIVLSTIFIISYKKNKDLFSPMCLFSFFQFLRYVPNIMITDYEHWFYLNNENTFKLMIIELVVIFSTLMGYLFYNRHFGNKKGKYRPNKADRPISILFIIIIYLVGLSSRILVIQKSGGISYILNNVGNAYIGMSSGSGYIMALSNLMIISMLMLLYKISFKKSRLNVIILITMICIYAATYIVFTSRSPIMELIMILAFGYNYLIKRYKVSDLLKLRYLIIASILMCLIVVLPIIRDSSNGFSNSNEKVSSIIKENIYELFDEFSNVGRDAFVYDHFNINNFWFGRSYLNLLVAPIPSSIYENKPPLDDGIYLNQLLHGYEVNPNDGRKDLVFKYSIPFSTQGAMYANFGILGVSMATILMGMLYAKIYKKLNENKNKNIFIIIVYQLVIYQLELSTLSITQTLIPLILMWITYTITKRTTLIKLRKNYRYGVGTI